MKFKCDDCGKSFLYAAVRTDQLNGTQSLESHICPYCLSRNFDELQLPDAKIVSVQSVDIARVDELIKIGYEVKELYAKSATMIRKS